MLLRNLTKREMIQNWNIFGKNHKPEIPQTKGQNLVPFMLKLKRKHAISMVRWYIGSFPINPTECRRRGGNEATVVLERIKRTISLPKWTEDEAREIMKCIETLKAHEPSNWGKRTREEKKESLKSAKRKK